MEAAARKLTDLGWLHRKLFPHYEKPQDYDRWGLFLIGQGTLEEHDFTDFKQLKHLELRLKRPTQACFPKIDSPMEWLELHGNLLGTIPSSLGFLQQLCYLGLGSNNLVKLPPEIGSLSHLISLDISANPITKLPKEFFKLTLVELFLSETLLTNLDNVNPSWLRELHLRDTKVMFSLPANLQKLYSDHGVAAHVYRIEQNGLFVHAAPLPMEFINTEQTCCNSNSRYWLYSVLHDRNHDPRQYNAYLSLK